MSTSQEPQPPPQEKRDSTPAAFSYWAGQVWPRRRRLGKDLGLWCALGGALAVTLIVGRLPARSTQIDDAASALMDYSAIGLGACITALVLAIGLAPEHRVQTWATTYVDGEEYSAYSELIFVMSWAASTQLLAAAVAWMAKLLGADLALMPEEPLATHMLGFYGATAAVIYAFWHLATVISTLSQIGAVTIQEAQKAAKDTDKQ